MATIVLVLWFVACAVALALLPLIWRMSPERAARGGPLLQRAVVPKIAAAVDLGVAFLLLPRWLGVVLVALFVLLMRFARHVTRSGRPAFLVPPALRAPEHGERVA
jgi:hypothetical protein